MATPQTDFLNTYTQIPHLPEKLVPLLHNLCGSRWIDLLFHLPTGVLDRSNTPALADAPPGELATFQVTVVKHRPKPYRNHRRPHTVDVTDGTSHGQLIFFGSTNWLERSLPPGETITFTGKAESGPKFIHPTIWGRNRDLGDVAKLWPIYPLTTGLSHLQVKRAIDAAQHTTHHLKVNEWHDPQWLKHNKLPAFQAALQQAHNPTKPTDADPAAPARVRLAADELLADQIALLLARQQTQLAQGIEHSPAHTLRDKFLAQLPFQLTHDQHTTLTDIDEDMTSPTPMLRLVQGDVGSGKTVVAFLAILRAIESGHQAALMAPTAILAEQHYQAARRWLEPLGLNVALLTGSLPAARKRKLKDHLQAGIIHLVIGTHALVEEDVRFQNLSLVVIDEQHRFGVSQRAQLAAKGKDNLSPDFLVMTATPIPRTLTLTAYGDMDTSAIREKPPGRQPIQTNALPLERLPDVLNRLPHVFAKGEQAYWICPLVEENETLDVTAATQRYEQLVAHFAPQNISVGLLHGKMKTPEKESIMAAFRDGEIQLLVATTVVEVGVDVPQASAILIEHAERFGLAQLHQLRGRVGRGAAASVCILLYGGLSEVGQARIQAMRESEDGFYLAEKDLELRGPGEILGTRQSGALRFRLADIIAHRHLISLMRDHAQQLLAQSMTTPQRRAILQLLKLFDKTTARQYLQAG